MEHEPKNILRNKRIDALLHEADGQEVIEFASDVSTGKLVVEVDEVGTYLALYWPTLARVEDGKIRLLSQPEFWKKILDSASIKRLFNETIFVPLKSTEQHIKAVVRPSGKRRF